MKTIFIFILLVKTSLLFGQIPEIKRPESYKFPTPYTNYSPPVGVTASSMKEDILRFHRDMARQQMQNRTIEVSKNNQLIPLTDFSDMEGTEHYFSAFEKLKDMLEGKTPASYIEATFLIENAYFENKLDKKDFLKYINEAKRLCELKMIRDKLPKTDLVKQMLAFKFMTDTFKIKDKSTEKTITNFPMTYDFDDYRGKRELSNLFVYKLMRTNKGQCMSLPMYYLMLTEALGTTANLSFSADHSFVKIKDKDNWYNLELTSGAILSDYHYIAHGFIKAEALRNKLYLQPATQKETIAYILSFLAQGYIRKYGYDHFVEKCIDTALEYYPNNIAIQQLKSNYNTAIGLYVLERSGLTTIKDLPSHPQADSLYKKMQEQYKKIDDMGYEKMPAEFYEKWLNDVEKEKSKPEYQQGSHLRKIVL